MKRYYLARLKVPHATISDTFSDFSTFITTYANDNYEKELVSANKIVAETKRTLSDIQMFEDHLAQHGDDLGVWSQYIDATISRPRKSFDPELTRSVYERAIISSPTSAPIWDSYILFLLDQNMPYSIIDSVLSRAVRACPKSGVLWAHFIRTRERFNMAADLVTEVKDRAFDAGLLDGNAEEYSLVAAAWLAYVRHQTTPDDDVAYHEQIDSFVVSFNEKFPISNRKDSKYVLSQLYIDSLTSRGELTQARQEWEYLAKKHAREGDFWLKRFAWERLVCEPQGDHLTAAGVLSAAIGVKSLDLPERVIDEFLVYERAHGTAFAIEKAEIKCKKLMRVVLKRRATEAIKKEAREQADNGREIQQVKSQKGEDLEDNQKKEEGSSTNGKRKQAPDDVSTNAGSKKAKTSGKTIEHGRDREHLSVIAEGFATDATEKDVRDFFKDVRIIYSPAI